MLTIERLEVTYPNGVAALKPVTTTFEHGSFVVLLGPSGAGKSTLLRCLNALVRPTGGEVRDDRGESVTTSRSRLREHRRHTGMVFQQHHLIGRLSALRNVLIGRLGHYRLARSLWPMARGDRMLALRALDRVGLADRALERADRLSGGQQQRVGIARALVQMPRLILADEPVASLDPATAHRVLADLHRVCREDGISAIVSLHQIDLAREFADRVLGLANGAVVFDGAATSLGEADIARIYGSVPTPTAGAARRSFESHRPEVSHHAA